MQNLHEILDWENINNANYAVPSLKKYNLHI